MTAIRPRYADTTLCPDCHAPLPAAPFRCPVCALPLQGFLADQLLSTLREADDLLARLRASALAPTSTSTWAPRLDPQLAPFPASRPSPALARRGLHGASVPKILLGLGAVCLLVAALIFLAVAWTWLGVGGRTVALVVLTATSGAIGVLLARRGLVVGAEALITVALGLVVLDLVGADRAGWLGDLSDQALVRAVGLGLLVPGLGLCLRPTRLVVPQLATPAGAVLVLASVDWAAYAVDELDLVGPVCVLALAGLCGLGRRLGATVLAWTAGLAAAAGWAGCGLWALVEATEHSTGQQLWADGHGWELLLMSMLALLLWAVAWSDPLVRQGALAVVTSAVTYLVVLPGLDAGPTRLALVAIAVTVTWAVVGAATPSAWAVVPRVPLVVGATGVTTVALALVSAAAVTVGSVGAPFAFAAAVRLVPIDQPLHPLLLVASVATLGLTWLLALSRSARALRVVGAALAVSGFATLALHPVPLWVVLTGLALAGSGLLSLALRRRDGGGAYLAGGSGALAVVVVAAALPSLTLFTIALLLTAVGLVLTMTFGRFPLAAEVAGLVLPLTLGGLIWSVAALADVDPAHRAVPALVVLGLLAILVPRPEVEVAASAAGLVATATAVPLAGDAPTSLAVHLTVAGALVTASSIVNPARRVLAWPGGLLLAAATWVRLADLGVDAPEAYTLPTAAALVLVGLHRLRSADDAPTASTLGPGLWLATVPSLLWVLVDPVTVRAAILGAASLLMLLAGARLRWHAPVLVGAVVGGAVVLRELTPYALQTPQWMLIGAAGTVLVACGITWESRMRDLQHATAYLDRLR